MCGADCIITRNKKDVELSTLPVYTAEEYMSILDREYGQFIIQYMPTIETLKQRELVSNVFLELNDYLCNKAIEFNDNVQSTDVDNADRGTLDDLIRNGELSLSLMRLAKFTQAENMKYIKETLRLSRILIHKIK